MPGPATSATRTAVATVVVSEAVTAPEALSAVAAVTGSVVSEGRTPRARVQLGPDAVATVETPKFGEDGPLSVDVACSGGASAARDHAETLARALAAARGWSVHVIGGAPPTPR